MIILARAHLARHPGPQPGHRLQGRPVLAGDLPEPDRGPGHLSGRVGRCGQPDSGPADQPAERAEADPGDGRPQLEVAGGQAGTSRPRCRTHWPTAAHTNSNNVNFNEVGPHLGQSGDPQGDRGADRLLHRGHPLHLVPLRVEDGHGRDHRGDPRHPGDGRDLFARSASRSPRTR